MLAASKGSDRPSSLFTVLVDTATEVYITLIKCHTLCCEPRLNLRATHRRIIGLFRPIDGFVNQVADILNFYYGDKLRPQLL